MERESLTQAAQYLRMSTEHQRYSTQNQRQAIAMYAVGHHMEIVSTYEDSGKSGLTLTKRPALQQLLADVLAPDRKFEAIVVLDVSRWGRFQDVDESAFYEFLCRRAGVRVVYCGEPFSDVDGPMGEIIKTVKRAMAAEYSRELSSKVYAGQLLLARKGYHMCGSASFGLKRVQVSDQGEVVRDLPLHESKSRKEDHVELAPGDPLDRALVCQIFDRFVNDRVPAKEIACRLNWSCYPSRRGLTPWRRGTVLKLLANEQYVGTSSYGKTTQKLRTRYRHLPREEWISTPESFEPIVPLGQFEEAQKIRRVRPRKWSNEDLLALIAQVHRRFGAVNAKLLSEHTNAPGFSVFQSRFGCLADACALIDIPVTSHVAVTSVRGKQRQFQKIRFMRWLDERYRKLGVEIYWHPRNRRVCIEGALTLSVRVAHVQRGTARRPDYWQLNPDRKIKPDACVFIRLAQDGEDVLDYFVLPGDQVRQFHINANKMRTDKLCQTSRCMTLEEVFWKIEIARHSGELRLPKMLIQRRRGTALCPRVSWE